MTTGEIIASAGLGLTMLAVLGRGLKAMLAAFHQKHVAPSIASVTTAIAHNTEATTSLTSALAKSNAAQERGFERLGDIIADHETRLTVLEQPPRAPKSAAIKRGRAA